MLRHPRAIARSPLLRLALLCALIVSLVAVSSPGRIMGASLNLYVSPTGSDSGACSTNACKTIGYVVSQAQSGATISIAPGTYGEHLSLQRDVTLSGSGTRHASIDGGQQGAV